MCMYALTMNENEPHFSITEAAQALGVSVDTLRRWDKDGTLTVNRIKVGKREDRRYTQADLDKIRNAA